MHKRQRPCSKAYRQHFRCGGIAVIRARQAYLALGGVDVDRPNEKMAEAARQVLDAEEIATDNDAAAGLAAATGELYGVVIIAGTGSIAMAVDGGEGRRRRSGGWGGIASEMKVAASG